MHLKARKSGHVKIYAMKKRHSHPNCINFSVRITENVLVDTLQSPFNSEN